MQGLYKSYEDSPNYMEENLGLEGLISVWDSDNAIIKAGGKYFTLVHPTHEIGKIIAEYNSGKKGHRGCLKIVRRRSGDKIGYYYLSYSFMKQPTEEYIRWEEITAKVKEIDIVEIDDDRFPELYRGETYTLVGKLQHPNGGPYSSVTIYDCNYGG